MPKGATIQAGQSCAASTTESTSETTPAIRIRANLAWTSSARMSMPSSSVRTRPTNSAIAASRGRG